MNMINWPFDQFRIHQSCSLPFNNLKQVHAHRPGVHSPRYFHTTHSDNNHLHQICSLFQMLQPSIACCYVEIIEDPSLLHWFPQEEYSFTQNLPFTLREITIYLKPPMFGCSLIQIDIRGVFTCIASPSKWRKTGVEYVTLTASKKSEEPPTWSSSSPMG